MPGIDTSSHPDPMAQLPPVGLPTPVVPGADVDQVPQGGPAPTTDTIEDSPTTVIGQNLHISGNPAAPSAEPPLTDAEITQRAKLTFGTTKALSQLTAELNNNPYFNVSFTATISAIMNEIAGLNTYSALYEALAELKTRSQQLDLAKQKAELTKESYNAQAQELDNNALNSFLGAAMAGASLAITIGNAAKAESDYNKQVEAQTAQVKAISKSPVTGANAPANGMRPQAELDADPKYVAATKELSRLETVGGKAQFVSQRQQHYDQLSKTATDMMTQVFSGITSSLNANLKRLEGTIESAKVGIDAMVKAVQDHQGRIDESRRGLTQAIDASLDLLKRIVDANISHHGIF